MKTFLLVLALLTGSTLWSFAQDGQEKPNKGERVEALKIAYLTKKLNLSAEEAQKFWPIYNKYIDDMRKTQADAKLSKEKEIDTEEKLLNIRKKYNTEFGKALSTEKTNSFFRAEREWTNFVKKEWMERRQQRLNRARQNP